MVRIKKVLMEKITRERAEKRRLVRKALLERERRCGNCQYFKENGVEETPKIVDYRGEKIKLKDGVCLNKKRVRVSKKTSWLGVSRLACCKYFSPHE